jgi:hypothetical protein
MSQMASFICYGLFLELGRHTWEIYSRLIHVMEGWRVLGQKGLQHPFKKRTSPTQVSTLML